jgi:ribonucleoside-diphosphate reductase alpha chain
LVEENSLASTTIRAWSAAEAHAASLEYFGGDELATDAFITKYALRDGERLFELTPRDMHLRLAREFARIEAKYPNPMSAQEILCLLAEVDLERMFRDVGTREPNDLSLEQLSQYDIGYGSVVPQGSPMAAIGDRMRFQSLSNCFVVDAPWDSYGGIFRTDEEGAQIMKRRGGVGNDVSTLRWKGASTKNAAGTSDGVALFCERFSRTTREVAQGGRRGARMLTIDVRHLDILDFVQMKQDLKRVTGANASTRIMDEFMVAVSSGENYTQRFPCDERAWHAAAEHARSSREVSASSVWDAITHAAWSYAEPGVLFWDTVIRRTPADAYADLGFRTISTNPCGELPLCAYDSCRLMVINLYRFVVDRFTSRAHFAWNKFHDVVRRAQRLMDDLVDLEIEAVDRIIEKIERDSEPEDIKRVELELWRKIRGKAVAGRRTGLGITGLGDCLAALGIRYGSPESIERTGMIYRALAIESYRSSCEMARDRGAFPIYDWERERDHEFLKQVRTADPDLDALWQAHGRRNIANTTTAPAGTISTQTRTTSGIENVYLIVTRRRRKLSDSEVHALEVQGLKPDFIDDSGDAWQEYTVHHPPFVDWMRETGRTDPTESPWWGATSADVDWVASVDLQGAAQRWVCHAISKTCNLPKDATVDIVKRVYMRAWEVGCKGITVYRDGCRAGVLLEPNAELAHVEQSQKKRRRPKRLPCEIHHAQVTVDGSTARYIVLVGLKSKRPYEVFCGLEGQVDVPKRQRVGTLVKSTRIKGVATYDLQVGDAVFKNIVELFDDPEGGALTRMTSLALRHDVPLQHVVEQLQKDRGSDMWSLSRVVARILKGHIPNGTRSGVRACEACGSTELRYQEGCPTCVNCGFSRCS